VIKKAILVWILHATVAGHVLLQTGSLILALAMQGIQATNVKLILVLM
jgi:hypothetical protein